MKIQTDIHTDTQKTLGYIRLNVIFFHSNTNTYITHPLPPLTHWYKSLYDKGMKTI